MNRAVAVIVASLSLIACKGDDGAQGAQGPSGKVGIAGDPGSVGPTGPIGEQGPRGATGATGPTGATGAMGVAGPAGPGSTGWVDATGKTVNVITYDVAHGILYFADANGLIWTLNASTGVVGGTTGSGDVFYYSGPDCTGVEYAANPQVNVVILVHGWTMYMPASMKASSVSTQSFVITGPGGGCSPQPNTISGVDTSTLPMATPPLVAAPITVSP